MNDVVLTPAQARALAVVSANHPDFNVTVYPAVAKGVIGAYVSAEDELYLIERDGTPSEIALA